MKKILCVGTLAAVLAVGAAPSATAQDVPTGEAALGEVTLPRSVMADGEPLAAGTYQVRLTAEQAQPEAIGQDANLSRWVEFRQGEEVRGREVVSIVPQAEIADIAKTAPPGSGSARVEMLRENEYIRVWINQSGTHYFVHLLVG